MIRFLWSLLASPASLAKRASPKVIRITRGEARSGLFFTKDVASRSARKRETKGDSLRAMRKTIESSQRPKSRLLEREAADG